MAGIVDDKVIICKICWNERKKVKSFNNTRHLNSHMKLKHDTKFKIRIANDAAMVVPRPKSR